MASLILPSRLSRQPQQGARLSQVGARFQAQTVFVGGTNITTGATLSPNRVSTGRGIGAKVALTDTTPVPLGVSVAASWSLLLVLRRDTQGAYPYFLGVLSGGNYAYALTGQHASVGDHMAWYDGSDFQDSGFAQPIGDTDVIGLTFDGATNRYRWYKNGRAYGSTVGANNGGAGVWQLAAISGESNTNTFPLLAIGSRATSAADMMALTDNPWQLFAAPQRNLFVGDAAASTSASAPLTGVGASSGSGSIAGSGGASAALSGVSAASSAGTILASGAARANLSGLAASAQAGTIAATGAAVASVTGVQGASQAGTIAASGAANASISGAQASGQAGLISATAGGNANAIISGVAAAGNAGTITPRGTASTSITGVSANSGSGSIIASAGAAGIATLVGVTASSAVGTIAASAGAAGVATITGVGASSAAGTITPSASAVTSLIGVQGTIVVGNLLASAGAGASASIIGVAAQARAGTIAASGIIEPNATATLIGVGGLCAVGTIQAFGTRSRVSVDVTEDMLCTVVRNYVKSVAGDLRVIRTPVNKASMPDGPFVTFTPMATRPLSTNRASYTNGVRNVARSDEKTFQIDCYGEGSANLAETLNILFRDEYAADLFAQAGFEVAPLYAKDVMQMPFVNDADQFEERYSFEIVLQFNPLVSTAQQSANILSIGLIEVDTL